MSKPTQLKPWQTLNSKIVHQTPWLKIIEDHCLIGDQTIGYTYTQRLSGALIIAETTDQKFWLVRQYRHPIKKIIWQFPAEGANENEDYQQTAQRGLQEELQLSAQSWTNLGSFYPDPGSLAQQYQIFLAEQLHPVNFQQNHNDDEIENLEIETFSRAEIEQLIKGGEICDNWTVTALAIYDRYKKQT